MELIKIKPTEMKQVREELVKKQKGKCLVCDKDIAKELEINSKGIW